MNALPFCSLAAWARMIADLPAAGPLPTRTILVPNQAIAHALRRELIELGHEEALLGTRFISAISAAAEILRSSGPLSEGEESRRPARLLALFRRGDLPLRYFQLPLLQTTPGWDGAFARTLHELESAGLRPGDLPTHVHPRFEDIATIWGALDESAGASWTGPRMLMEAAQLLERDPAAWPDEGPVLAALLDLPSPALARFLRAIPGARLAFSPARPLRDSYVKRIARYFGDTAAEASHDALVSEPPPSPKERDLLTSYLFAPPALLASPDRLRSKGPDDSVHLEEHAGTEAEIEAAAEWVARSVFEKGLPLDSIAVLLPAVDPLATLVADRIARIFEANEEIPVHIAGGKPMTQTAFGARALAILRALQNHLALPSVAEILPLLRLEKADDTSPSSLLPNDAVALVSALGTAGGHPGHPGGALDWPDSLSLREKALSARLPALDEGAEPPPGVARAAKELEQLRAILPAVSALTEIAKSVLASAPLAQLAPAFSGFIDRFLIVPGGDPSMKAALEQALLPLTEDATCSTLAGTDALRTIEDTLLRLRFTVSRFGEPAVYIGSLGSAVGLRFRAVRILGLSEGSLPSIPREDPVLPEPYRRALGDRAPRLADDKVLEQLHALDRVVRETTDEIVFSFARTDANRTQREPSSIFLDIAAALARPHADTGEPAKAVPSLAAIGRDGFAIARRRLESFRNESPPSQLAWYLRVAEHSQRIPSSWQGQGALDVQRIRELLRNEEPGAMDGLVESALAHEPPGLDAKRPISASRLKILFECPHRFLLQSLLGFRERGETPSGREIDALTYGSLFHRVAERFSQEHGVPFGERISSLADWQSHGDGIADRAFDELLTTYPLTGEALRSQQRERLRAGFRRFLEYDWNGGKPRRYFDVERAFGTAERPLAIEVGNRRLHVLGTIDRIDCEDGATLIRDLKTGKCHPREREAPNPERDVQLALYGIVVRELASEWGLPSRIAAAYAHIDDRDEAERAFVDDFDVLERMARGWLDIALGLLEERLFPRTPRKGDCTFCPFRAVCGDDAAARSAELLSRSRGTLQSFLLLKEESSA